MDRFENADYRWSDVLREVSNQTPGWRKEDYAIFWRHFLRSPRAEWLKNFQGDIHPPCFWTFLSQSLTSIEHLRQLKDFAKLNRDHPDSLIPADIGSCLYFLCIAVALIRHQNRISSLSCAELRSGIRWCLQRDWLDGESRELFMNADYLLEIGSSNFLG